jgi:hypothetical protein
VLARATRKCESVGIGRAYGHCIPRSAQASPTAVVGALGDLLALALMGSRSQATMGADSGSLTALKRLCWRKDTYSLTLCRYSSCTCGSRTW